MLGVFWCAFCSFFPSSVVALRCIWSLVRALLAGGVGLFFCTPSSVVSDVCPYALSSLSVCFVVLCLLSLQKRVGAVSVYYVLCALFPFPTRFFFLCLLFLSRRYYGSVWVYAASIDIYVRDAVVYLYISHVDVCVLSTLGCCPAVAIVLGLSPPAGSLLGARLVGARCVAVRRVVDCAEFGSVFLFVVSVVRFLSSRAVRGALGFSSRLLGRRACLRGLSFLLLGGPVGSALDCLARESSESVRDASGGGLLLSLAFEALGCSD
ncbi:hypothetical protein Tco_0248441 [Tanacetum coccineum]